MDSKTNMGGITVVAAAQVYNLVAGSANLWNEETHQRAAF
jgi:FlaG/FlaF family flagellin (archaellin)